MGSPGPSPEVTPADALGVFLERDRPSPPLTASEVAEALNCTRRTAHRRLEELAEEGELETKKPGAHSRVWWRLPETVEDSDGDGGRAEFADFVEAVEDYAIFTLAPEGTVATWNEGARRIKGYEREEILGEHFSRFYTEDAIESRVPERNVTTAADEGRVEDEGWRRRADGSRFWANVVITAIRDDDGNLQGFTKVTRDMTERREYERRIEHQRERTEEVLETAPIPITVQDGSGQTVMANERAEEVLGISEREIIEGPADEDEWTLYDENGEELDPDETPTARVLATGEPLSDVEVVVEDPSGERIWLSIDATPLPGSDNEPERIVLAGEDITELKKRQRALETELSDVFGRVSDAFYALDEEWRFTLVNDQAEVLLDHAEEELIGEVLWEAFPETEEVDEVREAFRGAMRSTEQRNLEVYSEMLGFWIEAHIYPSETGLSVYFRDITERKQREQELEKYETIVETIDDGVYTVDGDGHFTMVNEAYAELTGYPREELIGAPVTKVVDEETAATARERERRIADGEDDGAPYQADVKTADGDRVPAEATFGLIPAEDGHHERVGVVRDVTERVERERELERTLDLLDKAERIADVGGWEIDVDSMDVFWSDHLFDILGIDADGEPPLESALEVYHEDDRPIVERALDDALSSGDPFDVEARIRTGAGETRWLRVQGDPEVVDGEVVSLRGAAQDETDQIERERELTRRARQQQTIADLGQFSLEADDLDDVMYEAARQVAEVLNNKYCKVLDLDDDRRELLLRQGVGWKEGIAGSATVGADEDDSQAGYTLESEEPVVVEDLATESRFSGPDLLTSHDVASGVSTIIGSIDEPWGILGTHDTERKAFSEEDVNFVQSVANLLAGAIERHHYQNELESLVGELEESNERLERFAYVASHDLQEPLRMISNYLQLLERRYRDELDDDAEEFIDFAVDGADRMRDMISDLLAYSRLDSEAEPFEPVDINEVLDDVTEGLALRIEETDADVRVSDLPTVDADRNQFEMLFQNLLSNGIKYSGEEPPAIEVGADRRDDEWVFHVADDGIGMDPDRTEDVFDVFKRLHTHEEYSGTGIGLAMCKKIVDRHGGEIWVDSAPGEGSTVSFTLPVDGPDVPGGHDEPGHSSPLDAEGDHD